MLCLQGNKTCHCGEFTGMGQGGCCLIESCDVLHLHLCLLEQLPLKVKLDCKYKLVYNLGISLHPPLAVLFCSYSASQHTWQVNSHSN